MSMSSFIKEFRLLYSSDNLIEELGDPLITACAKQTLRRINKYAPRVNQRANLSIESESTYILLPSNFQSAAIPSLYKLKTGQALTVQGYLDKWLSIFDPSLIYYVTLNSGKFRADGRVIYGGGECQQETIQLFQTDGARWALWLDVDSAVARTESQFQYTASHELTDNVYNTDDPPVLLSPAKDTITGELRDSLLDGVMELSLQTQGRQLAVEAKDSTGIARAQLFLDQAKKYGQVYRTISQFGGAA